MDERKTNRVEIRSATDGRLIHAAEYHAHGDLICATPDHRWLWTGLDGGSDSSDYQMLRTDLEARKPGRSIKFVNQFDPPDTIYFDLARPYLLDFDRDRSRAFFFAQGRRSEDEKVKVIVVWDLQRDRQIAQLQCFELGWHDSKRYSWTSVHGSHLWIVTQLGETNPQAIIARFDLEKLAE